MKRREKKAEVIGFRLYITQDEQIRFIANTFEVKICDVVVELITTNKSIIDLFNEAQEINNNKVKNT